MKDPSNLIYRHNLNALSYEIAKKIFNKKNRNYNETKIAFKLMNVILPMYEFNIKNKESF